MNIKVANAIGRIKTAAELNMGAVFMGHSGGKDSCVIFDLVMKTLGDIYVVHNIKPLLGTSGTEEGALTEMNPDTLNFLYSSVCKNHPVMFFHSSEMPDMLANMNFTCQIDGSRQSESTRLGKSSEFIRNGVSVSRSELTADYNMNGMFGINFSYPIFDWSDDDVFEYINANGIAISQEYFKNGEVNEYLGKIRQNKEFLKGIIV